VQISRARIKAINTELTLRGTELVGALHPRHPTNQYFGGRDGERDSGRLTKRGVEICYRLYDIGKSPVAVS
jgi:hypothetical protein